MEENQVVILGVVLGLGAIGLLYYKSKFKEVKVNTRIEEGEVAGLQFQAYHSDTSVSPGYNFGNGGGVTLTSHTHTTPERNLVIIKGSKELRTLVIDDENLFGEVKEGTKVQIKLADLHKVYENDSVSTNNFVNRVIESIKINGTEFDSGTVIKKVWK